MGQQGGTASRSASPIIIGVFIGSIIFAGILGWIALSRNGATLMGVPDAPKINQSPVAFDFQGCRVGDELTNDFISKHGRAWNKLNPDETCWENIAVNGTKVEVMYQFVDFKLAYIRLSFEPDSFNTIVRAYTEKFGCLPHSTETSVLKNRLNAEFQNVTAAWNTDSGTFVVNKYGSSIDKGFALLESPEYINHLDRWRSQEIENLKKKL